jgi:predicted nucleic acid-binding protein
VPVFYADSSALVKLAIEEPGSVALRTLIADADVVSSELVLAEVPRAIRRAAAREGSIELDELLKRVARSLDAVGLRPVDHAVLFGAGSISEPALRTLDAIHIATAVYLNPISAFITYDERQAAVARLAGLRTVAPGA